jgi:HD superfamily phosphodiesterase
MKENSKKMTKKIYERIWALAKPYLNTRKNDIHTEMATRYAYLLLDKEKGDEEIVIPAIILHDVGWKKVPEELHLKAFGPKATMPKVRRVHEVEGVKIAREILEKINYDQEKIKEILKIIEGHDSREEPVSLNDKLVKDADKLWRYSKEGFQINRKRYEHTFEQYMERLRSHLNKWFITESGKEVAKQEIQERSKDSRNDKNESS